MEETKYKVRKAEQREQLPEIDLWPVIEHNGKKIDVAVFGPNHYNGNLNAMKKSYFHSAQLHNITFRPATTSKSISAATYDFENLAKPQMFDTSWLQAGCIVKTQDGVFTNTNETNESNLKQLLNGAKKTNGIYLINNQIAFIPYESFETGVQDVDTFAEGGLARGLEHVSGKIAPKLRKIASPKFYKKGVNVCFNPVEKLILRVAALDYGWCFGGGLRVDGSWGGDVGGHAFGELVKK